MLANPRGAAEHSARHGLLLAVGAATLWGTVGVASKMLPDGATLPSFDLAFARLAIAAPLLVLFSGLFLGRALWANAARAWPWIAAVGVLAACYQFCLFVSLEQLGVARTALLTVCLPPVLIAGASALVHHRRPSARTTGAPLMALGSLMLVTGSSKGHDAVTGAAPLGVSPAAWLGVACLLFATILLGLEEEPVDAGQPRRHAVTGQRAVEALIRDHHARVSRQSAPAHSLSRKSPGSMTTAKAVARVPPNRLLQRCR